MMSFHYKKVEIKDILFIQLGLLQTLTYTSKLLIHTVSTGFLKELNFTTKKMISIFPL